MATTYGALTYEQRSFYESVMLQRAKPALTYFALAQKGYSVAVPEHQGMTIDWRLMAALPVVTDSLTEGQVPDPHDVSISQVTATVAAYGAYVRYTREAAMAGIDNLAAATSEALGEQSGDSLDQLTRDVLVAGSVVQYASSATQRDQVTAAMDMTAAEIWEAVTTLKVAKAQPLEDGLFVGIVHPYTVYDMFTDSTIQNLMFYSKDRGERNPLTRGYIGDCLGVRWYETANAKVWASAGSGSANVYGTLILGKNAFGIGGLAGFMPGNVPTPSSQVQGDANTLKEVRPLRLISKDFGSAGADDPLEQKASLAWYTTYVTKILRNPFMVRIEHGCTKG